MALLSLPSLPRPNRAVVAAGGLAHRVLSGGLGVAQSLVDRLPGAAAETTTGTTTAARTESAPAASGAGIGANPRRRYGSRGSRDLAR